MFTIKRTSIATLITSVCLSSMAFASDLTLINHSNHDSTSVMNNGPCSADILGDKGVTRAHSINVVPDKILNTACILNKLNCKAEVHMTSDCTGPIIATVILDVKKGIKSITPSKNTDGYTVTGSGFTATVDGGPAFKRWLHWIYG